MAPDRLKLSTASDDLISIRAPLLQVALRVVGTLQDAAVRRIECLTPKSLAKHYIERARPYMPYVRADATLTLAP